MQKGQDTWLPGRMALRVSQADKTDSGENGLLQFTSRRNRGSKWARKTPAPKAVEVGVTLLHWAFRTLCWLEYWPPFKSQSDCFHRSCLT